jgi:very-short-patch-repair endonuclease
MHPDEAVARLALRQHGAVTVAQARAAGYSDRQIEHRRRTGLWRSPYRGVLAVAGTATTFRHRAMAAILAYGPTAVASHTTAAILLGILEDDYRSLHITLPYGKHRKARGDVVIHQAHLQKRDIMTVDSIPVTRPERTVVDVSGSVGERVVESILDDAIRLRLTTIPKIRERMGTPRKGGAVLRKLLDDREHDATQSALERMFRRKLESTDLPKAKRQYPIGRYRVDFAWPDKKIAVELDGLGGHFSAEKARYDKRRDRAIVLAGFTPMHFAWEDVKDDWPSVEADLRAVLDDL